MSEEEREIDLELDGGVRVANLAFLYSTLVNGKYWEGL